MSKKEEHIFDRGELSVEKSIVDYRIHADIMFSDKQDGVITQEQYEDGLKRLMKRTMYEVARYVDVSIIDKLDELKLHAHGIHTTAYKCLPTNIINEEIDEIMERIS